MSFFLGGVWIFHWEGRIRAELSPETGRCSWNRAFGPGNWSSLSSWCSDCFDTGEVATVNWRCQLCPRLQGTDRYVYCWLWLEQRLERRKPQGPYGGLWILNVVEGFLLKENSCFGRLWFLPISLSLLPLWHLDVQVTQICNPEWGSGLPASPGAQV